MSREKEHQQATEIRATIDKMISILDDQTPIKKVRLPRQIRNLRERLIDLSCDLSQFLK